jgi:hypothetical protein
MYLSYQWQRLFLFSFFRYDSLKNTAFEGSPLVQKKDYFVYGLGVTFYLLQSKEKVTRHRLMLNQ